MSKKISQQPDWPNQEKFQNTIKKISTYPQLVYPNEIEKLNTELLQVANGDSFIIQGGDCAETFKNFSENMIKNKLKILLQMSAIIQYTTELKTVNIGRIAGQYIKPRSNNLETRDGITLPSYKGDGVNSIIFDKNKRIPNPNRLIKAYHQSASTMNLIRSLIMDGFTDIKQIQLWHQDLLGKSPLAKKYYKIVNKITEMLDFARKSGFVDKFSTINSANYYTSHEALLLDYEKAFLDKKKNKNPYCCSAHMLWVGERTRYVNSDYIDFISKLSNPVGVKIGPGIKPDELCKLYETINPTHDKGKLSLITRLGANKIDKVLPKLIEKIKYYGLEVLWLCDPMHGNTIKAKNGYKTRNFDTIIKELKSFFSIHEMYNTIPGGIHVELTGENVTECLGGITNIQAHDLDKRYETTCDPRLNHEQSLEIAFLVSELLKKKGEKIETIKN